jgi:phenylalanyl-tRNA synthetase beta chain
MKISFNWLKSYLDFDLTPEITSEILTDTGLEIEGLEKFEEIKGGLVGVVVGEVLSCEPHPDADRLKVTQVNLGSETVQIVCGAPNVGKGQKVLVATVGTTLHPNESEIFKIKKAKIRGIESFGMICAEDELGLGGAHEGILVLPKEITAGTAAATFYDLYTDYQLEIGLTPNRCDAMGHIGVARDLKAFLNFHENKNLALNLPDTAISMPETEDSDEMSITIEDTNLCPRYIGAILENIKVQDSPKWLQNRLKAIGLEPINNVVDVSNFIMYEYGTPMHAFDRDKLGKDITVKKAEKGAAFKTLDGVQRTLNGEELMITSEDKNLCIAGVSGGLDSGVSTNTTRVFLESAIFNATSVRKTSKAHALQTDSSFRYERGVDPTFTTDAINRAISILKEMTDAKLTMRPVVIDEYDSTQKTITFSIDFLNERLGTELKLEEVTTILESLDFKCTLDSSKNIQSIVPQYRIDVTRPEDILEEVLRIYGFNKVELPKKWNMSFPVEDGKNTENLQRITAEWFVANGFNEVMNNSLRRNDLPESKMQSVEILNPLSKELETMRKSLYFGLLENLTYNQNRQQQVQRLFEFGKSYFLTENKYIETRELAFALCGKTDDISWQNATKTLNFYNLKQSCEGLVSKLGIKTRIEEGANGNGFFERSYQFTIGKEILIEFGQASMIFCKKAGVKSKVFIALCNWDRLLKYSSSNTTFKELPKTFYVRRDFSLILDEHVEYAAIEKLGYAANKKLLKDISLFDVYEGDKLPKGKKSYAVSFMFQDDNETLKDETIEPIMAQIRMKLEKELGAELRA